MTPGFAKEDWKGPQPLACHLTTQDQVQEALTHGGFQSGTLE